MDRKHLLPDPDYYEQLALGLELEEADLAESGFVSPAEARRRSESARTALSLAGMDEAPAWMEQYQVLLDNGWPWRVACYIAWAASPKRGRWPKTQEALAVELLGLTSDRQIGTWRRKNRSIDEVISVLQAAPLMERRADVLLALAESASNPNHRNNPDRKVFLEMTGDYVPRSKVELGRSQEVDDLSQRDEADLKRIAQQLEKRLQDAADLGAALEELGDDGAE